MKYFLYITSFLLLSLGLWSGQTQAQAVFNDTILFKILRIRNTTNNSKYLMEFQTLQSSTNTMTGKMSMSLCYCYCDSLWDSWPIEGDSLMVGGAATLTHMSSSGNNNTPGNIGTNFRKRERGILNIWQMPGSFSLTEAFSLPVVFILD